MTGCTTPEVMQKQARLQIFSEMVMGKKLYPYQKQIIAFLTKEKNTVQEQTDFQKKIAEVRAKIEEQRIRIEKMKARAKNAHTEKPAKTTTQADQAELEEKHWDGLARCLMSARDMGILIGVDMRRHLERRGQPIPEWLDIELYYDRHISSGDMCVWIYKAIRQTMTEDK